MTRLRACLLTLGVALWLSGCQTVGSSDGFRPIRPTAQDVEVISDSLARQILEHNEHGAAIGAWRR